MLTAFCVATPLLATAADWRDGMETFRVGMVAEPGAGNTIAGLGALNRAYGDALGVKVEFFVASNYPALIDAHVSGRIEYAIYSASAYAAAYRRCGCVQPLVAPIGEDGSIGIRSVLIARDGRLRPDADLAGRRIALLPPDSTAGHQLPLASFRPGGRPLSGAEGFFVKAGSAEAAEAMLVEGSVDAIFGWMPVAEPDSPDLEGGTVARLVGAGLDRSALDVVWHSRPLRYGPHAVSINLDAEVKRRLTTLLTGMRQADPELYERLETRRLGGFAAASQSDYAAAVEMIGAIAGLRPDAVLQAQ